MAIVNVPPSSAYEKEEDIQALIGAHNKNPAAHAGMSFPAKGGNADTVDGKHAAELQNYANLTNKPAFKAVATTGSYTDLINKPTSLPAAGGNANTVGGKTAADLLNYNNMTNKPASLPANGGNADTVDGKHAADFVPATASCNKSWMWSGQPGQPSWLWGSNDGSNMYVYNPSNFNVTYAARAGNSDTVDGKHAGDFILRSELKALVNSMLQTGEISMVKSIQSGEGRSATSPVKINAVNISKSMVLVSGGENGSAIAYLENSTTLVIRGAVHNAAIARWQVVEFY